MAARTLKTPFAGLLPPLSTAEKEALRADIKARGVTDPVWIDEEGNVLDGHNRLEIQPDAPTRIARGKTLAEKKAFVYKENFVRRNLSPEQQREVNDGRRKVAFELKDEGKTLKQIVALLAVPDATLSRWLSNNSQVGNATKTIDCRLKVTKEMRAAIVERCEAGESQAQIAADFGVSQKTVSNIYRQWQGQQEAIINRQAKAKDIEDMLGDEDHGVLIGAFQDVAKILPDESVDLIFTDPPYFADIVPQYGDLARVALRLLVDGGSLLCYAGHALVPKILDVMRIDGLRFYWVCACIHTGNSARMPRSGIVVKWKPILWFVKGGERSDTSIFVDDGVVSAKEKDTHEWQQGLPEALHYVERLCPTNGLVFDPFCGGGTTAIASIKLGRRYVTCDFMEDRALIARGRIAEAIENADK